MGFDLNQMIQQALNEGRASGHTKIAEEVEGGACVSCGRPAVADSKYCRECAEKKAKKEQQQAAPGGEETEKTSSERVEKLAAAVEYALYNRSWMGSAGHVKAAEGEGVNTTGPARGPNTLPTNIASPTTDKMPEQFGGGAKTVPPVKPALEAGASPKAATNAMQTDMNARPGGPGNYPEDGVLVQKTGAAAAIKQAMLKRAQDGDSTTITTPKTQTPTTPEDQPSQMARPAEVTSQEKMIASNEAAIDFTKRDAKAVPKKRMGEVLDEPAQSKSGDSVLQDALGSDLVNQAGAKVASALDAVQKIASEGCQCGGQGACNFCKIASRVEQKRQGLVGSRAVAAHGMGR